MKPLRYSQVLTLYPIHFYPVWDKLMENGFVSSFEKLLCRIFFFWRYISYLSFLSCLIFAWPTVRRRRKNVKIIEKHAIFMIFTVEKFGFCTKTTRFSFWLSNSLIRKFSSRPNFWYCFCGKRGYFVKGLKRRRTKKKGTKIFVCL